MRVIELDLDNENFVVIGDQIKSQRFFVWRTCGDRQLLISDLCPHRGGPLHLGRVRCPAGALTCPWHGMTWTEKALETRGIPVVIFGTRLTAVLPIEDPQTPINTYQTRIIANEHSARFE